MYAYINRFPAVDSVMADMSYNGTLWVWMIYIRDPEAARAGAKHPPLGLDDLHPGSRRCPPLTLLRWV